MKTNSRCKALFSAAAAVALTVASNAHAGNSGQVDTSALEAEAEFEIAQRRQLAGDFAPQAMQRGTEALAVRDYEKAFSHYRAAVDAVPDAPETGKLRGIAMDGFTKAAMGLAEQRIAEGRWEDAQTTVECLLAYNPNYEPAKRLRRHLESPDYFNKTVTPGFVSRVEQVKTLLVEAQGLYDSGRFEESTKKYEAVLRIDRFNIAARRGMEQTDLARTRVAEAAYNDTRAGMLTQVDKLWETRVPTLQASTNSFSAQAPIEKRGAQALKDKLNAITLKNLSFNQQTIRAAIDEIAKEAKAADPSGEGVNIILKLDPESEGRTITLDPASLSLADTLKFVTDLAGLKLKVDSDAVLVLPLNTADTAALRTRQWKVPGSFITDTPSSSTTEPSVTSGEVVESGAREVLKGLGVDFTTEGSSAFYFANTGTLVVRNTDENLDIVDSAVARANELNEAVPQVEIEAKFVEVTQDNLKELGFDWLLGQFAFPGGSGVYGGGGTTGGQFNGSQDYPFNYPGTGPAGSSTTPLVPVGVNPITAGNRSGGTAISANALDGLLLGNPVTGPASGVLALAGVFTNPQFQVVLRALNQKKGVDVLSAPKVTTISGMEAQVAVVREFLYPAQYEPPQVPQITGTGTQPITPATPTSFDKQDIGMVLRVVPTVDTAADVIDLELEPEISEFDGFINYGSPIENQGVVVTENVINYPVFSKRKVKTRVTIKDGQTVTLGGLIREDVQKVTDKTPILGDIPLAGALFRSQADKHIKRNLLIFVTASKVDKTGQTAGSKLAANYFTSAESLPDFPSGAESVLGSEAMSTGPTSRTVPMEETRIAPIQAPEPQP